MEAEGEDLCFSAVAQYQLVKYRSWVIISFTFQYFRFYLC